MFNSGAFNTAPFNTLQVVPLTADTSGTDDYLYYKKRKQKREQERRIVLEEDDLIIIRMAVQIALTNYLQQIETYRVNR